VLRATSPNSKFDSVGRLEATEDRLNLIFGDAIISWYIPSKSDMYQT
jgi:hypothetical protein